MKNHVTHWIFQDQCRKTGFEVVGAKKLKTEKERLFDYAGKHFMREAEVPRFLSLKESSLETISVNTQNERLQSFLSDETKILCTAFMIQEGVSLETYLDALLHTPPYG